MKVFKDAAMTEDQVNESLKEAKLLSKLGHEHIVRIFDANVFQQRDCTYGYFTMQYMAGGTLADYLSSKKNISVTEAVDLCKQVCRGLDVAHEYKPPIVHRDIKPQNLLIGYDGNEMQLKVSDFGLAKGARGGEIAASCRGTEAFMAPEALSGKVSPASDVWSIGTTLYLMLTGLLPNERAASFFNVDVGPDLDYILKKSLNRDANGRYGDAEKMLVDLESWSPEGLARAREAIKLSREEGGLPRAMKLMNEAVEISPLLLKTYDKTLAAWRRGILM